MPKPEETHVQPVYMVNPGPDKQKAIIVNPEAIKGFERMWADYAVKNDLRILPTNGKDLKSEWDYVVKMVHHAFEYGFHCNDMTFGEIEDDIAFALDKFAKAAGFPEHDWDADYEEMYSDDKGI